MASVLIKNLPDSLHHQLKRRAERHHRSLNKEVIALIEAALTIPQDAGLPRAVELNKPLDPTTLDEARQQQASRILPLQEKYRASVSSSDEFAAGKEDEIKAAALSDQTVDRLPEPVALNEPLDAKMLEQAREEGRA